MAKGKCILFGRVSTLGQSLDSQLLELRNEAKRLGYTNVKELAYKESGICLADDDRLGLQALDAELSKGGVSCVIVYELSRLSRRQATIFKYRDRLIECGVQMVCLKPYFTLLDNEKKLSQAANLIFSIFSSLSESEMALKKSRLLRGRIFAIKQGRYAGGNFLYGYTFGDNNTIAVDPQASKIVHYIYDQYEHGTPTIDIARYLVANHLLVGRADNTEAARLFVNRTLRNIQYTGQQGSTYYNYPQIIDVAQWNHVAELRKANAKVGYEKNSMVYYGKGLMRAYTSGRLLTPTKGTCQYRSNDADGIGISIHMNIADSLLWHCACVYHIKYNNNAKRLKSREKDLMSKLDVARTIVGEIRDKIADIDNKIQLAEERLILGRITATNHERIVAALEADKDKLNKKLYVENVKYYELKIAFGNLDSESNRPTTLSELDDNQRVQLIKTYIDKVVVDRPRKYWNDIYVYYKGRVNPIVYHTYSTGNCIRFYKDDKEIEIEYLNRVKRKKYGKEKGSDQLLPFVVTCCS